MHQIKKIAEKYEVFLLEDDEEEELAQKNDQIQQEMYFEKATGAQPAQTNFVFSFNKKE